MLRPPDWTCNPSIEFIVSLTSVDYDALGISFAAYKLMIRSLRDKNR